MTPPPAVPPPAATKVAPTRPVNQVRASPVPLTPPGPADFVRVRALLRSDSRNPKLLGRELWRLSKTTDPEALAILKEALASGQPQLRALAAAVLGASSFAEAPSLLRSLLQDLSPEVVCAAVEALGQVDLAGLRQWGLPALDAGGLPVNVQAQILVTLAAHGDEVAIDRALAATADMTDTALVAAILERATELTADVAVPMLQSVITSPQSSAELRGEAFEALAGVDAPEAASLLLQYASQRPSVAERRQAAEALGTIPDAAVPARQLVAAVSVETDVQTRVQLYDVIPNLAEPDPAVLLPAIQAERDPQARVAAMLSAGTLVGMGRADAAMLNWFETEAVRVLEASASSAALPPESRLRAVSGLRNAGTAPAQAALARLAQTGADEAIRSLAAQPLPRH